MTPCLRCRRLQRFDRYCRHGAVWCPHCAAVGRQVARVAARFHWQQLAVYGGPVDPWQTAGDL